MTPTTRKRLLAKGRPSNRAVPLLVAIENCVVMTGGGVVWRLTPYQAEKMADDLVDMAEHARVMGKTQ